MPTGIRTRGVCPVPGCGKRFKWNNDKGYFVCPDHLTPAQYHVVEFEHKGARINRAIDFNGNTLTTYAAALSLYMQAQTEIKGKRFDPTKWTSKGRYEFKFSTLIWKWHKEKESLLEKGRRAVTYVPKLKGYIRNYYLAYLGDMDVRDISPIHINEWYMQLPQKAPKTIKNVTDSLRSFFRWLHNNRLIDQPMPFPVTDVPEHEPEILSPEVQMMILEKIPVEHKPIFAFLFYQGCRIGEARALKWDCIEGDIVTYRRAFSGTRLVEHTKTKKVRHNLLFPETLAVLPARGFALDFVFSHQYGKRRMPYQENYINRIYRETIKAVNKEHGLSLSSELYEHTKHSFGTQYVNSGMDRANIKDWFGHTDMKTTEKYAKFKVVEAFRKVSALRRIQ